MIANQRVEFYEEVLLLFHRKGHSLVCSHLADESTFVVHFLVKIT